MAPAQQEVRAACDAWIAAVNALDFESMKALWDADFGGLVYQPEEYEDPMYRWEDILTYWSNVPTIVESVPEWREIDSQIGVVGDAALVYSKLWTSIRIRAVEKPFDGELRCSLGLRKTPSGWRLIHYHESRLVSVESVIEELTADVSRRSPA
jgi:ketosteroid isomerase-like protein